MPVCPSVPPTVDQAVVGIEASHALAITSAATRRIFLVEFI
jgi:hypothetical protein